MNAVDTIVYAPYALPMRNDSLLEGAAIAITNGRIVDIGDANLMSARYEPRNFVRMDDRLAMPGMINTHGHCPMIPYRGKLPPDVPFEDAVFKYMLPLEADFCARKDFVYLSARWALAELQSGGVTTTAEMYYFVEHMARAFREHNMRGILGETFMAGGTHRGMEHTDLLAHIADLCRNSDDLVMYAFSPHAPYTCGDHELFGCMVMAGVLDVPLLMHQNETPEEIASLFYASRPHAKEPPLVELARDGLLNHGKITLAHCNYLAPAEYAVLKNQGIGVAHNPVCNAGIGLETANLLALQSNGIPVGLATDGPLTNDRLDLLSQLKPAQLLHRMRHKTSEMFCPYDLVRMITSDAARALHRDDIGVLESGRWADIAFIDISDPAAQNYLRNKDPFGFLVNYAQASHVAATMVGGKMNAKIELEKVISELMPHLEEIAAWTPAGGSG